MAANNNSVALSDELLKEYFKFTGNFDYDRTVIERLLHYYKPVYITNISQLERINHTIDNNLRQKLHACGLRRQTVEELAAMTRYKIILSKNRSDFPYVNIYNDNIENNYTGTFLRSESRAKAIEHIKSLCADARKSILVYDNYFCSKESNVDILISLFPNRKLEIKYQIKTFSEKQINKIKAARPNWELTDCNFPENHDRYLIIDDKVEIILTSGFYYLNELNKEISYIVRLIDSHRF